MAATRRFPATTRHWARSVTTVLLAVRRIGSIPSIIIAPPPASGEWANAVRCARTAALSILFAGGLCASPAWSAGGAAKSNLALAGYSGPRCDDPGVYAQIVAEYRGRHGAGSFAPVGIRAREAPRRKYWPQADMPRLFCEGMITPPGGATRSDYSPRYYPIYYAIIANSGGHGLEWCVVGLDRPWVYDPRCRLARP